MVVMCALNIVMYVNYQFDVLQYILYRVVCGVHVDQHGSFQNVSHSCTLTF